MLARVQILCTLFALGQVAVQFFGSQHPLVTGKMHIYINICLWIFSCSSFMMAVWRRVFSDPQTNTYEFERNARKYLRLQWVIFIHYLFCCCWFCVFPTDIVTVFRIHLDYNLNIWLQFVQRKMSISMRAFICSHRDRNFPLRYSKTTF